MFHTPMAASLRLGAYFRFGFLRVQVARVGATPLRNSDKMFVHHPLIGTSIMALFPISDLIRIAPPCGGRYHERVENSQYDISETELLEKFFSMSVNEVKETFGSGDLLDIFAGMDSSRIIGTDPSGCIMDFEEEAEELRQIVTAAKKAKAEADKQRSAGSLQFLATKLGKTARQVRDYCKAGLVPGARQTAGGHWRVDYQNDTVDKTRAAIGEFARVRSVPALTKALAKYFEAPPPSYGDETPVLPFQHKNVKAIQLECAVAARLLLRMGQPINYSTLAKAIGRSWATVRKHAPGLKVASFIGNVLVDRRDDAIRARTDGRVLPGGRIAAVHDPVSDMGQENEELPTEETAEEPREQDEN